MLAATAAAYTSRGNSKSISAYPRCNGGKPESPMIKKDKRIGYVKNSITYPILFSALLCYNKVTERAEPDGISEDM